MHTSYVSKQSYFVSIMLLQICAVNNYKVCAKQSLFNSLKLQHYEKCRKSGRDTIPDIA